MSICSNPEDFFGNKYNDASDNLIIVKISNNNFICLTRNEVASVIKEYTEQPVIIQSQNPDEFKRGEEDRENKLVVEKRFYQLPYSGMWIDHTFKDLYEQKINTMEVVKMEGKILLMRSVPGIQSGMHDYLTDYYQVKRLSRNEVFKTSTRTDIFIEKEEKEDEDEDEDDEIIQEQIDGLEEYKGEEEKKMQDLINQEIARRTAQRTIQEEKEREFPDEDESADLSQWGEDEYNENELYRDAYCIINKVPEDETIDLETEVDLSREFFEYVDNTDYTIIMISNSRLTTIDFISEKFTKIILVTAEIPELIVKSELFPNLEKLSLTTIQNDIIKLDFSVNSLKELKLKNVNTQRIQSITNNPVSIGKLFISRADDLIELPKIKDTNTIKIEECESLQVFDCLIGVYNDLKVELNNLESLRSIPYLPEGLKKLVIKSCDDLVNLPENLPASLELLIIVHCPSIARIPNKLNPNTEIVIHEDYE